MRAKAGEHGQRDLVVVGADGGDRFVAGSPGCDRGRGPYRIERNGLLLGSGEAEACAGCTGDNTKMAAGDPFTDVVVWAGASDWS